MICPKCHCQSPDGAHYCSRCGAPVSVQAKGRMDLSSILLIAWVVLVFLLSIAVFLYTKFVDGWYRETTTRAVYAGLLIAQDLTHILPAIAIKNLILKIVGIVIVAATIIWWVAQNVIFVMSEV